LQALLARALQRRFGETPRDLRPGDGQGNHLTFLVTVEGRECFIRIEDGPERDDYMEVEACALDVARAAGVPTPMVYAVDSTRSEVPFAWQVLERVPYPDLNQLYKQGRLDLPATAERVGRCVARWQAVTPEGFGPFRPEVLRAEGRLAGHHSTYSHYFEMRLEPHLAFLIDREFLTREQATAIRAEIDQHRSLLELRQGCLVHKDLALWNILGTSDDIAAVIDWDDCIVGDPMDDFSLLGCFYDGAVLQRAFAGYAEIRPLPVEWQRRFWLHLLRNMLVKAVIRVGAGYFELSGGFFLIGPGGSGADLKTFTQQRIQDAVRGLREALDPRIS
jgi:fructosamine-3-kinase